MNRSQTVSLLLASGLTAILPATALANAKGQNATNALDALVISASRNQARADQTPQKTTVITRQQLQQQLAITNDPGQVLSNLIPSYSPGRQKLSNAGETFRGRSALFLVDGVPQSNPLRDSARDSYTIDLSMVERIEVIHGASAEHGLGATGGIINFVTRKPEGGRVNQSLSASVTTDDGVDSDGQGYKLNYRVSGQRGDWEYLAGATLQERGVFYDGRDEIVGIAYPGEVQNSSSYDLLAKVGYWLDDDQNIEFFVNRFELEGNGDYVPVQGDRANGVPTTARRGNPDGDAGYNEVTTARLSYSHDDWLGNRVDSQLYSQTFRAQFGTTPYFPYLDGNDQPQLDQTRNESDKLGGKFTLTRDGLLEDCLTLTTGLDLLQDETRQMLVETGRTYVPKSRFRNLALFLQGDLEVARGLTLHAGARHERAKLKVDTYNTIDRSNVTQDKVTVDGGNPDFDETLFNAGVVYQINDWAQVYGNYSEGFGMPDVGRVLRGISESGQDVDSLLQLQPIVTDNREVGTRFNWDRYRLDISYYESDSDYGERLTEVNGVWVGNREKTEIKGAEVTAEADLNDAHALALSYTYASGKSDTDGDGSVDTKLTGINIAPETVKLRWSAQWSQVLSSQLQLSHYLDRNVDGENLDFDGYSLVDGAVTYRSGLGRLSLGIENLLDEDYVTYYSQAARASDDYYFTGRGRTLTLGYQLDF
ncbi:TonB-dependent receptor [Marinobacter xestospongiae]|uniref:TonB-dependent receptor n=1 Tax=Marinobacter xestospongiae TaxID=994319 RepID=A0ABU3VY26_9GAMM|nr:TonB-dependent receptor [Marinobacter xestospongiae]MDV2079182.1 TonB-dependent receptor [Marinobacter xestospongiae]